MTRVAAWVAATSGTGWLALKLVQRSRRRRPDSELSRSPVQARRTMKPGLGSASVVLSRFCGTFALPSVLPERRPPLPNFSGRNAQGLVFSPPSPDARTHYFGDLKIATLMDVVCMDPTDAPTAVALAVRFASAIGCDLIVSTRCIGDASGVRTAGFLHYRSNYLLGTSKALTHKIRDEAALVTVRMATVW